MAWRVAKSLDVLLKQVNEKWPNRDKSSDGSIGDEAHSARESDHNPNPAGVVCARDFTNDPNGAPNSRALAENLVASKDQRIKYLISNAQICSGTQQDHEAWVWRPYAGTNDHRHHMHISVKPSPAFYDDTALWKFVAAPVTPSKAQTNIVATVFGGVSDPNNSAYTGKLLNDTDLYVALPYHFAEPRPLVWVENVSTHDRAENVLPDDVGPWNINNPYWETGQRPQAEGGIDMSGRNTNKAGIDLSPALAKKLKIPGKGLVNWGFMKDPPTPVPPTDWKDFDIWGWIKSLFGWR
jgi:hypothetical protein